eukprot:5798572-Pyramimonas_sp.AAC.1
METRRSPSVGRAGASSAATRAFSCNSTSSRSLRRNSAWAPGLISAREAKHAFLKCEVGVATACGAWFWGPLARAL